MDDAREADRHRMVDEQLVRRGIRDACVLDAMRSVPRERFVDAGCEAFAYDDCALPIAATSDIASSPARSTRARSTISQPYVVAWMVEAASLTADDRVLEVGAGSGYAAAVMSRIAASVDAIERHATLVVRAQERLDALGYRNARVHAGDGTRGWPPAAPFDAIVVSAGAPDVPSSLVDQLVAGGRLVMPVGREPTSQRLRRIVRRADGRVDDEELGSVQFVPLIGANGWTEDGTSATSSSIDAGRIAHGVIDRLKSWMHRG